jgi:XTP/dITP diphosphohydrolase
MIKIVIASGNKGKIKEFQTLLPDFEVLTFKELLGDMDIIEDGSTFKENAIIKAKTIQDKLKDKFKDEEFLVISDDSGISVKELNYEPNIYSARYAGTNATDKQNNEKLIKNLQNKGIKTSDAFYTAAIAISYKDDMYTTHGWMHGKVIDKQIGDNGFGYDPLFIPKGYDKTLGELDFKDKKDLSHRTKALNLAMIIIKNILKQK